MPIILVRHGETQLNAARVVQPADTPLSARGREQAAALARRLALLGVSAILSSDLPRTLQTAAPIAAATGLPVRTTALLQERNFGDLRGRAYDSLGFDPLATGDAPPGGESVAEFEQRVARAFAEILAAWTELEAEGGTEGGAEFGRNLVVVTHGLVIRTIIESHLARSLHASSSAASSSAAPSSAAPSPLASNPGSQVDPAAAPVPTALANTSITIFEPAAPHRLMLMNCVSHLDEAHRDDGRGLSGF